MNTMPDSISASDLVIASTLIAIPLTIVMIYSIRKGKDEGTNKTTLFLFGSLIGLLCLVIAVLFGLGMLLDSIEKEFSPSWFFLFLCSMCLPIAGISTFVISVWLGRRKREWEAQLEDEK